MENIFHLIEQIGSKGTKKLEKASKLGSKKVTKRTICYMDDYEGCIRFYNAKEFITLLKLAA